MAARFDFAAEQGATFDQTLTFKAAGVAVDLTGYSAKLQVRASYGAGSTLLDLTSGGGAITLGGAAGTIRIVATAALTGGVTVPDTGDIPPKLFAVYDLILTAPGGAVTRLLEGQFTISRRVSV